MTILLNIRALLKISHDVDQDHFSDISRLRLAKLNEEMQETEGGYAGTGGWFSHAKHYCFNRNNNINNNVSF